jgi:hypothetical protein
MEEGGEREREVGEGERRGRGKGERRGMKRVVMGNTPAQ